MSSGSPASPPSSDILYQYLVSVDITVEPPKGFGSAVRVIDPFEKELVDAEGGDLLVEGLEHRDFLVVEIL